MRCISPHAAYSIQVFEAEEQIVTDARGFAQTVTLKKPHIANFHQGGLMDWEIEAALERFSFSGVPEGVNPLTMISSFDTEAYAEAAKGDTSTLVIQLDARLRELQEMHPNEFIIVEPPAAPRPWPSYDEDTVEEILAFQERLRVAPTLIRLYELENKNRKGIVQRMLEIEDPEAAERYAVEQGEPVKDVTGLGVFEPGDHNLAEDDADEPEVTVGA